MAQLKNTVGQYGRQAVVKVYNRNREPRSVERIFAPIEPCVAGIWNPRPVGRVAQIVEWRSLPSSLRSHRNRLGYNGRATLPAFIRPLRDRLRTGTGQLGLP